MKQQRYEEYIHRYLWKAAECNVEMLDAHSAGASRRSKSFALAGMVLAFFALEGYLNWLLERFFPDVWEKEKEYFSSTKQKHNIVVKNLGTIGKLEFCAKKLNCDNFVLGVRPWQSAIELREIRNILAHSKPEKGDREVPDYSILEGPEPYEGSLEKAISPVLAKRYLKDVKEIADILHGQCLKQYPDNTPNATPFCGLLGYSSTASGKSDLSS